MTRTLLILSSAALLASCGNQNPDLASNPYGVPQSDPYGTPPPVTGERGNYTAESSAYQPLPNSPEAGAYTPETAYAPEAAPADDIYGGLSPSAPAAAAGPTTSVTVGRGDTLWGFSKKYGVSVDAIRAANNMAANDSTVRLGQTILIPSR